MIGENTLKETDNKQRSAGDGRENLVPDGRLRPLWDGKSRSRGGKFNIREDTRGQQSG